MVNEGETLWRGINFEVGTDIYTLLYMEWMSNKELLHRELYSKLQGPTWEKNLKRNGHMHN